MKKIFVAWGVVTLCILLFCVKFLGKSSVTDGYECPDEIDKDSWEDDDDDWD